MRWTLSVALLLLASVPAYALIVGDSPLPMEPIHIESNADYVATVVATPRADRLYVSFVDMDGGAGNERIATTRVMSWGPSDSFRAEGIVAGPAFVQHSWLLGFAADSLGDLFILTATSRSGEPGTISLLKSDDGGSTWRGIPLPVQSTAEVWVGWGDLASDGQTLYITTQETGGKTRVFRSVDQGETFEPIELTLDSSDVEFPSPTPFLALRDGVVDVDAAGGVVVAGRRSVVPLTHQHISLAVAEPEGTAFSPQRVAMTTKVNGFPNLAAGLPRHVTVAYDAGLGPGLVRGATTTNGGLTWIDQPLADWVTKDERVDIFMGQSGPGIDADDEGNVVAAWTQSDKATGLREIGYAASRDGGLTWTLPGVLPTTTAPGVEGVNAHVTIWDGVAYIFVRDGTGLAMYPVPL